MTDHTAQAPDASTARRSRAVLKYAGLGLAAAGVLLALWIGYSGSHAPGRSGGMQFLYGLPLLLFIFSAIVGLLYAAVRRAHRRAAPESRTNVWLTMLAYVAGVVAIVWIARDFIAASWRDAVPASPMLSLPEKAIPLAPAAALVVIGALWLLRLVRPDRAPSTRTLLVLAYLAVPVTVLGCYAAFLAFDGAVWPGTPLPR